MIKRNRSRRALSRLYEARIEERRIESRARADTSDRVCMYRLPSRNPNPSRAARSRCEQHVARYFRGYFHFKVSRGNSRTRERSHSRPRSFPVSFFLFHVRPSVRPSGNVVSWQWLVDLMGRKGAPALYKAAGAARRGIDDARPHRVPRALARDSLFLPTDFHFLSVRDLFINASGTIKLPSRLSLLAAMDVSRRRRDPTRPHA